MLVCLSTVAGNSSWLWGGALVPRYEPWAILSREACWLRGSAPDCCPAVPGSNLAPPQPTSDCQSSGGLPPGMALGCGLISVRGESGENYEK